MVDGAANLLTYFFGLLAHGLMSLDIGTNMLDGGAPYYQTYETRDGKFMAVGASEARFYELLLQGLGLDPSSLPPQNDGARWPELTARFAEVFRTKTRDQWTAIFEGKDACVAPVLDLHEVGRHAHNKARGLITTLDWVDQPAPAPRLSRTPGKATKGGTPSLKAACEAGVLAEIKNWTMYAGFLETLQQAGTLPRDVQNVFSSLLEASRDQHLPAFEACAAR